MLNFGSYSLQEDLYLPESNRPARGTASGSGAALGTSLSGTLALCILWRTLVCARVQMKFCVIVDLWYIKDRCGSFIFLPFSLSLSYCAQESPVPCTEELDEEFTILLTRIFEEHSEVIQALWMG